MENKEIKLNEKQISSIKNYLAIRLNNFRVNSYDWEYEDLGEVEYFRQKINPKGLGIFTHSLKECFIEIKSWVNTTETKTLRIGLRYSHKSGGSNGCELDINLRVKKIIKWMEEIINRNNI